MPYIAEELQQPGAAEAVLEKGEWLAIVNCDFCGKSLVVPADRSAGSSFCNEICFRARYGAKCSDP